MMVFALLLSQAQAVPQAPPETDIVVIGKRLAAWRGKVATTIGVTTCKTTISTGDKDVDDVGCTALKRCWSEYRPQLASARKRHDKGEITDVRGLEAAFVQCFKSSRDELVDQLVARRRVPSS